MLKVLKPGFYTTVQDIGRIGYLNKGVPVSGNMDANAALIANQLLDNRDNAAVLEITMTGPTLVFEKETYISLTGAKLSATLNNKPITNNKVYKIYAGDILSYGKLLEGLRGYLAIKNGFLTEKLLGSRSYYYPITKERCLESNTTMVYEKCSDFSPKISPLRLKSLLGENVIKVYKGPEFYLLNDNQLASLFSKEFSVAKENDRMAYQIEENIEGLTYSMLTSATLPGTIQLTPSGKLIVLMKDGQTTGGYPRILQLTEEAICILAQKKYRDKLSFRLSVSN
ncbi:biotin-dependent carboxyltransferase family protein [uncultured Maribacter sp.]|uniref:5-oxoprolinase subunit C family protein n=1 Tax=uncultured Maribacter sp. TaxID=431308 RepID=UPI0026353DC2|nr:biotin-dependent carboxyltransferase family protein [uncultured Maribacter sp.]